MASRGGSREDATPYADEGEPLLETFGSLSFLNRRLRCVALLFALTSSLCGFKGGGWLPFTAELAALDVYEGARYSRIEAGVWGGGGSLFRSSDRQTIVNHIIRTKIRYGGADGMFFASSSHVAVRGLEISWIGGGCLEAGPRWPKPVWACPSWPSLGLAQPGPG